MLTVQPPIVCSCTCLRGRKNDWLITCVVNSNYPGLWSLFLSYRLPCSKELLLLLKNKTETSEGTTTGTPCHICRQIAELDVCLSDQGMKPSWNDRGSGTLGALHALLDSLNQLTPTQIGFFFSITLCLIFDKCTSMNKQSHVFLVVSINRSLWTQETIHTVYLTELPKGQEVMRIQDQVFHSQMTLAVPLSNAIRLTSLQLRQHDINMDKI